MTQLTIYLKPSEKDALILLAEREYRDIRSQAALIIRTELERRSLLLVETQNDKGYSDQDEPAR